MTIKNKKLTMNLIGGGVFAIANIVSGSALATSITQTFSFSGPSASGFAVQLFDSTLGTLNSVDATLSGTWTASGNAIEPFPGPNATANIFVHGILELSGSSAIAVDLSALTIDLSGWSPAVTIVGGNFSGTNFSHEVSGSASTSISGILLADFIQTGGGVLGVDLNFGGAGSFISTNALAYGITGEFGNAQLTLTYDYTQASSSVPEPATMALLSAGLFAYGAVRRHRQS